MVIIWEWFSISLFCSVKINFFDCNVVDADINYVSEIYSDIDYVENASHGFNCLDNCFLDTFTRNKNYTRMLAHSVDKSRLYDMLLVQLEDYRSKYVTGVDPKLFPHGNFFDVYKKLVCYYYFDDLCFGF